jgi:alpha-mannosidase
MRRSCTTLLTISLTCLMLLAAAHAQSADKPDLSKQPTLYVVGYAYLDTEWRWEYPHHVFNFSGASMTLVPPAGS